jgi:WD40 repeat protein
VTDAGLAVLKDCKSLKDLRVSKTQVGDAGIDPFKDCTELTQLSVEQTRITAAKIAELKKALPNCKIDSDTANAGSVALFNGKDLTGWEGLADLWKYDGGTLTGSTVKGLDFNTCLCSKAKYKDFEFTCKVRIKNGIGNSGIQIRSELIDPTQYRVKGAQADMGDAYWGSLYGEQLGGMMKAAPKGVVEKVLKKDDFNDYSVRVVGNHVTIKLNGATTVDDDFPAMPAEGIIGFQLHAKFPGQEVTFKDIRFAEIKEPEGGKSPDPIAPPVQEAIKPAPPPAAELVALKREKIAPDALKWAGNGDPKKAPNRLVAVLGDPQPRHTPLAYVQALAFSPNGKWLASGCDDKTVILRDGATGRAVRLLAGHTGAVRGIGFSKDGKTLASSSTDGTIRLWPVDRVAEPQILRPGIGEIWGLAVSADGRFLAAGGTAGGVKLWKWGQWDAPLKFNEDPKKPLSSIKEWKDNASLALSPDGLLLAVRTQVNKEDAPVYLYKTATGQLSKTLPGVWVGDPRVYYSMWMHFSADGKSLASFSAGKGTAVWDIDTGKRTADYPSDQFGAIALSPDNAKVALVRNFQSGIEVYDRATQKRERILGTGNGDGMSITFSPDGKTLAAWQHVGSVQLWDTATWERKHSETGHTEAVFSVEFSPDGRSVLSSGFDRTVRVWDLGKPGRNRVINKFDARLRFTTAGPDQKKYVTLGGPGKEAIVWDAATDKRAAVLEPAVGLHRVVFSPDGKLLAGSSEPTPTDTDTFVYLWDAETGKQVHRFPHQGDGRHILPAFSRDGRQLAVASPAQLKVWDVAGGNEVQTWAGDAMCAVAFRPDGALLATGHADGTISYWDLKSGKKKAITGHTGKIHSLKFTPDGKLLVSSAEDGTVRVWNPELQRAGEIIPVGPTAGPVAMDVDPSGKFVVAAGPGAAICILRIALP